MQPPTTWSGNSLPSGKTIVGNLAAADASVGSSFLTNKVPQGTLGAERRLKSYWLPDSNSQTGIVNRFPSLFTTWRTIMC